ncbi:nucleotide sugar dehydrogenase [Candidatus Beckwithbacteria bacterium]|nr:nucleotide sugar dehydrogenase [Candidatus Beckwithbacteria bacterium]
MKISIIGLGYVGCVNLACLAQNGHMIWGVDISKDKVDKINKGEPTVIEKDLKKILSKQIKNKRIKATQNIEEAILNTNISLISVATPSSTTGHPDLSALNKVAQEIGATLKKKSKKHLVVIRSTVPPKTSEKIAKIIEQNSGKKEGLGFDIAINPEFLREGSAIFDYYNPPYILFGIRNNNIKKQLKTLYKPIKANIIFTDFKTAEIIKYINNTYHALKVTFTNEISNICQSLDIDSVEVLDLFKKDKQLNISTKYFNPGFAYGGSCLPKDLKALQTMSHDLYLQTPIIENIDKSNQVQIDKAISLITSLKHKNIGFLGISFKAGTDDLRNSPTIEVIKNLIGSGYKISIYDLNYNENNIFGKNKTFIANAIPHFDSLIETDVQNFLKKSDTLVITTKEKRYLKIAESTNKKIVDLAAIDKKIIKRKNYHGLSW